MNIPLISSLNGAKLVLPRPLSYNSKGTCRFNGVSCKATNFAGEKRKTNFYEVLSLDFGNAGLDEIKRAYRAMALQYHPDVCHPCRREESTRIFVELNRAYKTLADPISRKKYDRELNSSGFERNTTNASDSLSRERWEEQLHELRRRSDVHAVQKEGSWGSRLRAQRK